MKRLLPPEAVAKARLSETHYPGVVAALSDDARLCVSQDLGRYYVQRRGQTEETDDGFVWLTVCRGPSLAVVAAKLAGSPLAALLAACGPLPDDPAAALPAFAASVRHFREVLRLTDWARDDYSRVIAREGSARLAVSACGGFYLLQHRPLAEADAPDIWKNIGKRASAAGVLHLLGFLRVINEDGEIEWDAEAASNLRAIAQTLPEKAEDGQWRSLPKRPF